MGQPGPDGLVDAERFLALTERLRDVRDRIADADTADRRRTQWQRLLVAATNAAKEDLDDAERRLVRLEAELERHLR